MAVKTAAIIINRLMEDLDISLQWLFDHDTVHFCSLVCILIVVNISQGVYYHIRNPTMLQESKKLSWMTEKGKQSDV